MRRETRGSHYREDCPEMSSAPEWALVHRGEDGHPIARFVPVKPTNT
jgi:succinate dehydrogenase/fumarate reductase flavoprotein subunit